MLVSDAPSVWLDARRIPNPSEFPCHALLWQSSLNSGVLGATNCICQRLAIQPLRNSLPGEHEHQNSRQNNTQIVDDADLAAVTLVVKKLDGHDPVPVDIHGIAVLIEQRIFIAEEDRGVIGNSRP